MTKELQILRILNGLILFLSVLGAILTIYFTPTDFYGIFLVSFIVYLAILLNLWLQWNSYLFN